MSSQAGSPEPDSRAVARVTGTSPTLKLGAPRKGLSCQAEAVCPTVRQGARNASGLVSGVRTPQSCARTTTARTAEVRVRTARSARGVTRGVDGTGGAWSSLRDADDPVTVLPGLRGPSSPVTVRGAPGRPRRRLTRRPVRDRPGTRRRAEEGDGRAGWERAPPGRAHRRR